MSWPITVLVFVTDDFPGVEELIGKLFPFADHGRLMACNRPLLRLFIPPPFWRGSVPSAGGDKSYTGSFKHRVGERILFCHISRQAGAHRLDGPCVFPVMHGARLAPPALRGRTTAHRFFIIRRMDRILVLQDGGEGDLWGAPIRGHSTPCCSSPWEIEIEASSLLTTLYKFPAEQTPLQGLYSHQGCKA